MLNGQFVQAVDWLRRIPVTIRLTIYGGLMALIFYLAFGKRYNLAENGSKAWQSIATLNNMSAEGAFLYIFGLLALFAFYWIGARQPWQKLQSSEPEVRANLWWIIGGFAVLFNVVMLPMYPADAADIYDYIIRGRMSAVYGLNPLHNVPSDLPDDPFYRFSAWRDTSGAYGPAWETLASLTSRIAGDDYLRNVIAFKLLSVVGYAVAALFIGLTLHQLAPDRTFLGVYLFAWNPMMIYVAGGTGHNDTVMAACMAVSVYCLVRRWYAASTLSAVVGALVKIIPILLVPIIAIVALRDLSMRGRIRYLLASAILCGLVIVLAYAPYWIGLDTLNIGRAGQMYTGSVATLARQSLQPLIGDDAAVTLIKYSTFGLLGLFYLIQLAAVYRDRDQIRPIRAAALVIAFYLLVADTWFQSWYITWLLVLVVLLDNTLLRRLTLLFAYLVTWQPFLYNYVTLRPDGWADLPWRDLIPVAAVMGITWGYIGWFWLGYWRHRTTLPPLATNDASDNRSIS